MYYTYNLYYTMRNIGTLDSIHYTQLYALYSIQYTICMNLRDCFITSLISVIIFISHFYMLISLYLPPFLSMMYYDVLYYISAFYYNIVHILDSIINALFSIWD